MSSSNVTPDTTISGDNPNAGAKLGVSQQATAGPPNLYAKVKFYSTVSVAPTQWGENYKGTHNPFFYDHEIEDVQYSARLYPSTGWVDDDDSGRAGWFPLSKDILRKAGLGGNGTGEEVKYSRIPLIQAIYSEDFNVSAVNDWNDANFGTDLQDSMNRGKMFVPYMGMISRWTKEGVKQGEARIEELEKKTSEAGGSKTEEMDRKTLMALKGMKYINNLTDKLGGLLDNAVVNLDKTSIIQGTRFSYYSGTGISFGNLVMKFTLFSDYKYVYYPDNDGKYQVTDVPKFVSVSDQLSQLYDYSIGKYFKWLDVYNNEDAKGGTVKSGEIKSQKLRKDSRETNVDKVMSKRTEEVQEGKDLELWDPKVVNAFLNTFMGWQSAPGGYKPKPEDIDATMIGTFRLEIGTHYAIENLVIQDIQLNYSRQMVKYPKKGNSDEIEFAPLYCEVQITLRPATKFSNIALEAFTRSKIEGYSDHINYRLNEIEEEIKGPKIFVPGEDLNYPSPTNKKLDRILNKLSE